MCFGFMCESVASREGTGTVQYWIGWFQPAPTDPPLHITKPICQAGRASAKRYLGKGRTIALLERWGGGPGEVRNCRRDTKFSVLGWLYDDCIPNCLFCSWILSSTPLRLSLRVKRGKKKRAVYFWNLHSLLLILLLDCAVYGWTVRESSPLLFG